MCATAQPINGRGYDQLAVLPFPQFIFKFTRLELDEDNTRIDF